MAPAAKRKFISHATKLKIIQMKETGQGNTAIGRQLGLSESTVRTVCKQKDAIKNVIKSYGPAALEQRSRVTNPTMILMERYLGDFLARKCKEGVPITQRYIQEQAKLFYSVAAKRYHVSKPFTASTGWLAKFLKRKDLRNVKFTGERLSADTEAAQKFPITLKAMIEEGGYSPELIYNCDETALYYKAMPRSTYIFREMSQARGRKVDKSRVTAMFAVNLRGTHKLRPVIIHTAAHPRCYKNIRNMEDSGVHWYKSANGWMTSSIFCNWVQQHFIPAAKHHARLLGLEFKAMLILDNAPSHPSLLDGMNKDCKIVFLPPRTTSLVQPLDQELIASVKLLYHQKVYNHLRDKTDTQQELRELAGEGDEAADSDMDTDTPSPPRPSPPTSPTTPSPPTAQTPEMTVLEYWRRFTVKDGVDFMLESWNEITTATINHAWRQLTPHLCAPPQTVSAIQKLTTTQSATLSSAQSVPGCQQVTLEEIQETHIAEPQQDPLEVVQVTDTADRDRDEMERREILNREEEETGESLSPRNVSHILLIYEKIKDEFNEWEPCKKRRDEVLFGIEKCFRYYQEKHRERTQHMTQTLITRFLRDNRQQEEEEEEEEDEDDPGMEIDDTASVVSAVDFEGFMQEVNEALGGGESSGAGVGD